MQPTPEPAINSVCASSIAASSSPSAAMRAVSKAPPYAAELYSA